jgi:hypothetical protein
LDIAVGIVEEESLEHGAAGEEMEPALGGFRIAGLCAENFAGGAEPREPRGVFGAVLFFEFPAKALSESGAFAVGGDGDLKVAALDDGPVIEMAVVDVVDGIAKDVALLGFEKNGFVDIVERSGSDDEEHAEEIIAFERFWEPVDFTIAKPFDERVGKFGSDDGDASAGFEESGNFTGSDGAATDDENGAVVEFEECREKGHGLDLGKPKSKGEIRK